MLGAERPRSLQADVASTEFTVGSTQGSDPFNDGFEDEFEEADLSRLGEMKGGGRHLARRAVNWFLPVPPITPRLATNELVRRADRRPPARVWPTLLQIDRGPSNPLQGFATFIFNTQLQRISTHIFLCSSHHASNIRRANCRGGVRPW